MDPHDFVHLHIHTEYSLLDGSIRVKKLLKELTKRGLKAAGVTDHDTMHAIIEFYLYAQDKGLYADAIKKGYYPEDGKFRLNTVLGYEVNVELFHRKPGRKVGHLVLLAENDEGYTNLVKLCSIANTTGRNAHGTESISVTWDEMKRFSKGIICLTANLLGELPLLLRAGQDDEARSFLAHLIEVFGRENLFVELCDNNLAEQKALIPKLVEIAREAGVGIVATGDVHYLEPADKETHLSLLAIKHKLSRASLKDVNTSYEFHLTTYEEMERRFAAWPEALENTKIIADRCHVHIDTKSVFMPDYRQRPDETADDCFVRLAREGLETRKPDIMHYLKDAFNDEVWKQYQERLEYEISVILKMKFSGYFLIVQDFINWAKDQGIPVGPGRGSAAGSLATYCLRITNIDPLRFNLLFERFLNPERISMPDIDTDFCMDRRGEVLDYVYKKYGEKAVAQIVTFGRMKAKNALKNLARIHDWSFRDSDAFAKLIPNAPDITLEKALEEEPKIRERLETDERSKKLWDEALKVEGILNSLGIHAAGVIISDRALDERCPLMETDGQLLTQYEYKLAEKIGLIKFDFLGLKTLTVIQRAVDLVRRRHKPDFDIDTIEIEDRKVYEMLGTAQLTGIFQLESTGMRQLIAQLKPTCFSDIVAVEALFRPGPLGSGMVEDFVKRKHDPSLVEYPFPELKEILSDTYGVIVYQEQVQKIAVVMANYTLGEADLLRRAMGKKDKAEMERQKARFVDGAVKNGHDETKVSEFFDLVAKFAEYGFNKSHSAAYGYVTYQTAFLKCYYTAEFMAAIMSCDLGDTDKIVSYVRDCRRMGIKVLPPSINDSDFDFTIPANGVIQFGLGAIKGLGQGVIETLVEERRKNGPYRSVPEFIARVDARRLNKKVMESLVKAGAFDCIDSNRSEVLINSDAWLKTVGKELERQDQVGDGIFGGSIPAPLRKEGRTVEETPQKNLEFEKKLWKRRRRFGVYFPWAVKPGAAPSTSPVASLLTGVLRKTVPPWSFQEQLDGEIQTLGFWMTAHPADAVRQEVRAMADVSLDKVETVAPEAGFSQQRRERRTVKLAGIISSFREKTTMDGMIYYLFKLEDGLGELDIKLSQEQFVALKRKDLVGWYVCVEAQLGRNPKDNNVTARCVALEGIEEKRREMLRGVVFHVDDEFIAVARNVSELKELVKKNPGRTPAYADVALLHEGARVRVKLPPVEITDGFIRSVEDRWPGVAFVQRSFSSVF